eukprot:TRINITY_DN18122_c0_g1_i1.p4 TRINITY_DN18122_c0_g1~~TRINITY_DN18122_c0_g1_i1.p4  ORF type:complete len:107 (+),score=21.07 TRINITY_DN18122_c0_g1_i1:569-889(+)
MTTSKSSSSVRRAPTMRNDDTRKQTAKAQWQQHVASRVLNAASKGHQSGSEAPRHGPIQQQLVESLEFVVVRAVHTCKKLHVKVVDSCGGASGSVGWWWSAGVKWQ